MRPCSRCGEPAGVWLARHVCLCPPHLSYADCLACRDAGTEPVDQPPTLIVFDPQFTDFLDPAIIAGHRLSARYIAQFAWSKGFDFTLQNFELSRAEGIAACWWAGLYGRKVWRQRYGAWAKEAARHMWHGCGQFSDPPARGAA